MPTYFAGTTCRYFLILKRQIAANALNCVLSVMKRMWADLMDAGPPLTCAECLFLCDLELEPVFLLGSEDAAVPPCCQQPIKTRRQTPPA